MKYFVALLLLAAPAFADGPLFGHKDRLMDQEFDNVYHDIDNVLSGTINSLVVNGLTISTMTASSATITNLSVTGTLTTSSALGKVVKYVSATTLSAFTTTSTSFVDTNLTATITPASTSNKVLILAAGTLGQNSGQNVFATLERDTTDLASSSLGFLMHTPETAAGGRSPATIVFLDSPSTTSATTYTVQIRTSGGGSTGSFGTGADTLVIILVELS